LLPGVLTLEGAVATRLCHYELWNVNHSYNGWLASFSRLAQLQPVHTADLRRQTLARWRAFPAYLEGERRNQREGLHRGYSAPKNNVRRRVWDCSPT